MTRDATGARPDVGRLVARAVDAAWARSASLGLLLALLSERCEVELIEGAGTARIAWTGTGTRVELDPAFLRRFVRDGDDLVFLLAHEVLHRVQGDLIRGLAAPNDRFAAFVANIVADVRINGHLLRGPFATGARLLDRCYSEGDLPGLLLLPPSTLLTRRAADAGHPGLARPWTLREVMVADRDALGPVVTDLFLQAGASDRDLATKLAEWYLVAWCDDAHQGHLHATLQELLSGPDEEVRFLGGHDSDGPAPWDDAEDEELARAANEVAGEGQGQGTGMRTDRVAVRAAQATDEVRRFLRRALDPCARDDLASRPPVPTVVPTPGRREAFLLAAGAWPGLFRPPAQLPDDPRARARIYLDVSGSTSRAQPYVYGLLVTLRDLLVDPVHQFSTEVVDVALADLARGVRVTDGGTLFDPVLRHALATGARRIVVVTDGQAPVSAPVARAVRRARLQVHVLLTERCPSSPLFAVAASRHELPVAGAGRRACFRGP